MSRPPKEAAAGRPPLQAESADRSAHANAPPPTRWLSAPRRRPVILGIFATLYLAWLLILAGMAVSAL